MDLQRPDFPDSRDPIIIFSEFRHPIFNSRDPNRVPTAPYKNSGLTVNGIIDSFFAPRYFSVG